MSANRPVSIIRWLMPVVLAACCMMAAGARADQPTDTSTSVSLSQSNELKARTHYLAGEEALKSGDALTAIVEWETTLRLKPDSEFTTKRLLTTAKTLSSDAREAYAHFLNTCDLQDQGKIDDAEKELALALTYHPNSSTPACLAAKSQELAALKKAAAKPADKTQSKDKTAKADQAKSQDKSQDSSSDTTSQSKPAAKSTNKPKAAKQSAAVPRQSYSPMRYPAPPKNNARYYARVYNPYQHAYKSRVSSKLIYIPGYYRKDGKYVKGHTQRVWTVKG